jgi:hypothetical protein
LSVRWDHVQSKYTFLNGSSLPENEPLNYPVEFWEFHYAATVVKVSIARQDNGHVSVRFQQTAAGEGKKGGSLQVFNAHATEKPIWELELREGEQGPSGRGVLTLGRIWSCRKEANFR